MNRMMNSILKSIKNLIEKFGVEGSKIATLYTFIFLNLMLHPAYSQPIPTNSWSDYWGDSCTINGNLVQPGDTIRAYDPDSVLCGEFIVVTTGNYGYLHVYGDDPTTSNIDEGAVDGDTISFSINGIPAQTSVVAIWHSGTPGTVLKVNLFAQTAGMPGDINNDGILDLNDIDYLASYLYYNGPPPVPLDRGDLNGDSQVDDLDLVKLTTLILH